MQLTGGGRPLRMRKKSWAGTGSLWAPGQTLYQGQLSSSSEPISESEESCARGTAACCAAASCDGRGRSLSGLNSAHMHGMEAGHMDCCGSVYVKDKSVRMRAQICKEEVVP
jgi:hypothetical protein